MQPINGSDPIGPFRLKPGVQNTRNISFIDFGQIGIDYSLGDNVLSVDYSKGKTNVNTINNSLITGFSDIETESFKISYNIKKDNKSKEMLMLILLQEKKHIGRTGRDILF